MIRKLIPALLLAALLPACATITSGTTQNISVVTEPPGATCQLQREGATVGVVNPTPGTVNVSKSSRSMSVACTRPGSLPASQAINPEFQAMTAGNILIGGLVGLAVDAASGAMAKYPETVTVSLPPATFSSDEEREAFFATRVAEARRGFAARIEAETGTCSPSTRDACLLRVSAIEAERDAALAQIEAQRLAARRT